MLWAECLTAFVLFVSFLKVAILTPPRTWIAHRVDELHKIVITQCIPDLRHNTCHDAHRQQHIVWICDFDANLGQGWANWSHTERNNAHHATYDNINGTLLNLGDRNTWQFFSLTTAIVQHQLRFSGPWDQHKCGLSTIYQTIKKIEGSEVLFLLYIYLYISQARNEMKLWCYNAFWAVPYWSNLQLLASL